MKIAILILISLLSSICFADHFNIDALFNANQKLAEKYDHAEEYGYYHRFDVNPENYKLIAGLPKHSYRILEQSSDPEVKDLVDDIVLAILKTEDGKKICRAATYANPEMIGNTFGLSSRALNQAIESCGPYRLFDRIKLSKYIPFYSSIPTRYSFIFSKNEPLFFNGWTGPNSTVIGLSKDTTEESLVRSFIHEIYQTADSKGFVVGKSELQKIYNGQNFCRVQAALINPYVRMAFSAIRAFQVEDRIVDQMGLFPKKVEAQDMSCSEKVKLIIPYTQPFIDILKKDIATLEHQTLDCGINFQSLSLEEILDILDKEQVTNSKGKEQSLCQYFSTPEYGFIYSNANWLSKGPSPRIGDGSGISKSILSNDLAAKKLPSYDQFKNDYTDDDRLQALQQNRKYLIEYNNTSRDPSKAAQMIRQADQSIRELQRKMQEKTKQSK